ncbi:phosphoenolpyruvate--protein phosphotransferase [Neptunomonas concharum]|uniref:phosphoenolpyruvate--protein phosphotransferase n=1 Tax=Neptunomonas concharum TaxID=1031538 RepID=A0A5P1RFR5_9GAMM|nr:phosphoenolpyruvate--protein phosphotransferase [Neptunomonas concharum]QEQ98076.1 phosphoenolpyruvate--protein phosphotransferase [Neptunomonas concharum]
MLELLRKIVQEVSTAADVNSALDLIVRRIQRDMKTEVCSVFLFDPSSQRFVLRASQGLNRKSIGKVSLSSSEGIVGMVARRAEPINLEDAETHPAFCYLQETGEERFHAFLGVPIIHQRQVLGVLVVQQKECRRYDESEEAFLVTVSAQLAGVIALAEATGSVSKVSKTQEKGIEYRFEGVPGAPGVAIGTVVVVAPLANIEAVPEKEAEDIELEIKRFQQALDKVRKDIRKVSAKLARRLRHDEQALFDVYLRMLDDNALSGEIVEQIRAGSWAPGALSRVIMTNAGQFAMMDDPYLRERATDIRDLGRRVLSYLQEESERQAIELPENAILVADELSPALLGEVSTEKLAGLVSVHGSGNSHAAIIARSMGIPTVMGIVDLPYRRLDGRHIILDGYSGRLYVDPSDELLEAYREILREQAEVAAELATLKELPAITQDGVRMPLWVNTGLIADVARSLEKGAEGIGLYRTEIPFMVRDFFPSEHEQTQIYRKQLEAFAPLPVTMRTLDIGGDKALPYFPIQEENPFLGWRGIRVTLDHPEIFLVQIRAMLRANEGLGNLRIMLPMVTSVHEVDEAKRLLDRALAELQDEGYVVERPLVGVMIEVPAAVYQARLFAQRVDFISVGSNDLTQYLLAVDRNNPRVAGLYMAYHPAVLKALEYISREAHKEGVQVSICGEMAAEPGGALLLMAMGYDVLSMNATNLPGIKSAIRGVTMAQAEALLAQVSRMDDADKIQALMSDTIQTLGLSQLARPVLPD